MSFNSIKPYEQALKEKKYFRANAPAGADYRFDIRYSDSGQWQVTTSCWIFHQVPTHKLPSTESDGWVCVMTVREECYGLEQALQVLKMRMEQVYNHPSSIYMGNPHTEPPDYYKYVTDTDADEEPEPSVSEPHINPDWDAGWERKE
jgi:hypothetical protein